MTHAESNEYDRWRRLRDGGSGLYADACSGKEIAMVIQ